MGTISNGKNMDRKIVKHLAVGTSLILILITMYILGDEISPNDTGRMYYLEKVVRSIFIMLIAFVSIKIIVLVFLVPIEEKRGRLIPKIVKGTIGFLVFFIALSVVISHIYGYSVFSTVASVVVPIGAVGYIFQDLLKEIIAGLIIDMQDIFRVGDWLKFPDGKVGKLRTLRPAGAEFTLEDETQLYINNSALLTQPIINFNQYKREFYAYINVVLDHDVSVGRARRILYAATVNADGVYRKKGFVFAEGAHKEGVNYGVYFKIADYDELFEVKHQVIKSIERRLHKHDIKVSSIIGELKINDSKKTPAAFDDSKVTNEVGAIKLSGILTGSSNDKKKEFAKQMTKLKFKAGELILVQGEQGKSMFLIAEGVVRAILSVSSDGENSEVQATVAHLSDGDFFGEMELLRGEPNSVTIIAETDVVLYEIGSEPVKAFMKKYPDFAQKLNSTTVERLTMTNKAKKQVLESLNKEEGLKETESKIKTAFKDFLGI